MINKNKKKQQVSDFGFSVESAEQSVGFMFWQVTNLWQKTIGQGLEPLNLTHVQYVILANLAWLSKMQKEEITQVMIANNAQIDVMMTSKVIRALIAKKLISRRQSKADSRAYSISLTQAGEKKISQAIPIVEQIDEAFFVRLGTNKKLFLENLQTLALLHKNRLAKKIE